MSSVIIGDKSNLPRAARRTEDSHFDNIWNFYYDTKREIKLDEIEKKMQRRWEFAWLYLSHLLNKRQIVKRLIRNFDITEQTAYSDIKNAKNLFGDPSDQNKAAKKAIMSQILERAIKKAEQQEDWKALEKLMLRYSKINDLDKEDDPLAEYLKNRKPAAIVFVTDADKLRQEADELMSDVEDTDFEDVTDEAEGPIEDQE